LFFADATEKLLVTMDSQLFTTPEPRS